jgi:hypothetical protein
MFEPISACYFLRAVLKVLFGRLALRSLRAFLPDCDSRLYQRSRHFHKIDIQDDTVGEERRDR